MYLVIIYTVTPELFMFIFSCGRPLSRYPSLSSPVYFSRSQAYRSINIYLYSFINRIYIVMKIYIPIHRKIRRNEERDG